MAALITERCGIEITLTAGGRLLSELQITSQGSLRRADQRDRAAIDRWVKQEFPRLRTRAKQRDAQIVVSSAIHVGKARTHQPFQGAKSLKML